MDVTLPVESSLPSITATASATGRPGSIVTTLRAGNNGIVLMARAREGRHRDAYSASSRRSARGPGGRPACIWHLTPLRLIYGRNVVFQGDKPMEPFHVAHLIALGMWLGVVITEVLFEFAAPMRTPFARRRDSTTTPISTVSCRYWWPCLSPVRSWRCVPGH